MVVFLTYVFIMQFFYLNVKYACIMNSILSKSISTLLQKAHLKLTQIDASNNRQVIIYVVIDASNNTKTFCPPFPSSQSNLIR